ncbi:hypothetical protein CRUP_011662 [Coryphaenoides rupestris]|nr:hypothetical protein CRUP_011662 [Coryphaenoides rupestris]
MAQGPSFSDLEESCVALVNGIKSSRAENLLLLIRKEQGLFLNGHQETKTLVEQVLKDMGQKEEKVCQRLLGMEQEMEQAEQELCLLEEQLESCRSKGQLADSDIEFLQRELESLRCGERELQELQQEVNEDTIEIIPSAIYMAQLYHQVTRIKWDHDTPPHLLKGVHYGKELTTPIDIDTTVCPRCDISDQLWAFVSTEW